MNTSENLWRDDLTLDEVEILYITQASTGSAPPVAQLIAQYPQWAHEITLFALGYAAQEKAWTAHTLSQTEIPELPESLQKRLEGRLQASRQPARNLNEARKALGWTPDDFAQKLNLPTSIVVKLGRGLISNWPRRLESKISEVLLRPVEHVRTLLQNSRVVPATNFSAQGPISSPKLQPQSFRSALEECDNLHELTEDQKEEWFSDELL